MPSPGIYVESFIRADVDAVWTHTQSPEIHQRWDLRFTTIEYLPRTSPGEPQHFLYETRLLPGIAIRGTGESTGQRLSPDGDATSALSFGSPQPWSLIRTGSGYWRYLPTPTGTRFLTWYDYQPRFGALGRLVDRLTLRPAMGWATAWSFDRLRLWIEQGQSPELSLILAAVYTLTRLTVAFVWLYHGLVPKLLAHDPAELTMLQQAGLPPSAVLWAGAAEVFIAIFTLLLWRSPTILYATAALMLLALVSVALRSPQYLTAAFNPVTLNLSVASLAVIAALLAPHVPTATNCLRRKPADNPKDDPRETQ